MLFRSPALTALAAVLVALFAGTAAAQSPSPAPEESAVAAANAAFNAWRDRFRARALKEGIPHDVFEKALGNIRPDPKVHEKNDNQPEFIRPVWDYLDGALSETRIRNGRKMLQKHAALLASAEKTHGVPRRFLVAIWGMETSYGALLGRHNIFEALATLSYQGDRTQYAEEQLLAALRLLADGHKPLQSMKGSWAGAVGHTQFVPTTYLKYAVDGDNDGRRDLWDSLSDVFHSTANYLKHSGFDRNLKWGREAVLPEGFDHALAGDHVTKTLSEWRTLGVKMTNGALVPDMDITASILLPAGHQGPAFLVYENFQALLTYNRSISYALAIGLLSDRIQGGPSLQKSWPRHLKPLKRDERMEIQQRLAALGYAPGKVDGVLGRDSRDAIRNFQKDHGEIADGYATVDLIAKLRAADPGKPSSDESASLQPEQGEPEQGEEVTVLSPQPPEAQPQDEAAAPDAAARGANAAAAAGNAEPVSLVTPALAESAAETAGREEPEAGLLGGTPRHAAHEAAHGPAMTFADEPAAAEIADSTASPPQPLNNGAEPIVSPPGTVYVGAAETSEPETAADAEAEEGEDEDGVEADESEAPEEDKEPSGAGS